MIVDCHNDLLLELSLREFQYGDKNPFATLWMPQLAAGGLALQVCAASSQSELAPDGCLREVLDQVIAFGHAVAQNPEKVLAVRSREDVAEVRSGRKMGLMLAMEGAEALGRDPWQAEAWWNLGMRMLSLTWQYRNFFADGAGETGSDGGLSRIGRSLVEELSDLGVMIDLAHASERTFWDVLGCARDATVLVSHAACRAVCDLPRNLTDDQMRAVAERGGVVCLMFFPFALGRGKDLGVHLEAIERHLAHALDVVGEFHVGLGADFFAQVDECLGRPAPLDGLFHGELSHEPQVQESLDGPEDYPRLGKFLQGRGYKDECLQRVLGENLLELFARGLPSSK